jgi:hypothetical protein
MVVTWLTNLAKPAIFKRFAPGSLHYMIHEVAAVSTAHTPCHWFIFGTLSTTSSSPARTNLRSRNLAWSRVSDLTRFFGHGTYRGRYGVTK